MLDLGVSEVFLQDFLELRNELVGESCHEPVMDCAVSSHHAVLASTDSTADRPGNFFKCSHTIVEPVQSRTQVAP